MMKDRFELINIGDEAEISHTIIEQDVQVFAGLTGDTNPLHMDEAFASQTTFKKRVVHGMLTASFISTIIGTKLPGCGALWYEQKLRFLRPVRIGERIRVVGKVIQKSLAQRILVIETLIYGDDGKRVVEGEARVKVLDTDKEDAYMGPAKKGAVIVTGGGRGIGAATAKALAREGYPVVVNFLNNSSRADEVVNAINSKNGSAISFKADVSSSEDVKKMVAFVIKQFGSIFGVVHNAAPLIVHSDFMGLEWKQIQSDIDVHVKGAFNLCHEVLPYLTEQKNGCIVNVTSIYADNVPPPKLFSYVMAKSALAAFSRSLAVEYGPMNIRINCVAPGMTETDLIADVPEKTKLLNKMQTPLRRLAAPEDIAGAIIFLFSDKARHITGETIRVCGGMVML